MSLIAENHLSINQKLEKLTGTSKIDFLNQVSEKLLFDNIDSSFIFAVQALELSRELNNKNRIIESEINVAKCYEYLGDNNKAIEIYKLALNKAKELDEKLYIANISINIGHVYSLISDYENALDYNLNALKIYKEINNQSGLADSYHSIAIIYYYILNLKKANEYNFKALELFRKLNDSVGIAKSLSNTAMIYIHLDSLTKAIDINFKALNLMIKFNNKEGIGNSYTNIGTTYYYQGKFVEAAKYLNKAIQIFQNKAFLRNRTLALAYLGLVYCDMGDYNKALEFAQEGYNLAYSSKSIYQLAFIYNLFSEIYMKTGDFKKAVEYKNSLIKIRDTIFNNEKANKILEKEIRIETEQKSKEYELLQTTNRLQLIMFIIVSILILIIAVVLYSRYKTKQKANKLLEEKNSKITEQNTSLEILNKELNEANAAKDKFFSIMAHDLKSPLWWFKNVTDLLANKYDQLSKEKIMEITKVLDDSAQTSLHLIENLLQWSRSQSGRIEFIPEKINLKHVFDHIMAHHKLPAESKNINVEINIPDGSEVIADKNMLYSILRNLLSNAIKFTNINGKIVVNLKESELNYSISIKDNGVGIDPANIENIFRIDIQTTTLGTAQEKGTGLGLIITKEFITKHGGELLVDSIPNEGSTFTFTIPKQ